MVKKSQKLRVLDYLNKHGSITTMEAFQKLSVTRLAAQIFELERMGIPIDRETVRDGREWYVVYRLKGEING